MKRTDLIVSGVVDSDFAGDTTKKSTYCRYTYLDRCLINFTTKLQKTVATSTCNAEFNGIAEAMTDVIYYRACTAELKGKFWPKELSPFTVNYPLCDCPKAKEMLKTNNESEPPPSVIKNDNAGAVAAVAKAGATAKGTKNEVAKQAFVKKCVELGIARLEHQAGADIVTDMGTKAVPPVAFAKKLKDAQPSEEELNSVLFHLAEEKELYELEPFNTYQPLPGDPGYDSEQELKTTFDIEGYLSDEVSDISIHDNEYLKANHVYTEDEEPFLVPLYVDEDDLRESLLNDPEKKLNLQQYAQRLAFKTQLNLPDTVYRYPNSRLKMVRDKEGEHRRRILDGTFAQSAAEEKRVFCVLWCNTKEYYDAQFLLALNVTIIYDFGDANPLRVVIDVPRTLGTTLSEFVERYVGTMFNQPLSKFRVSLNGKKLSEHKVYKCSFTLVDNDVVTITPKELGLMGGGREQRRHHDQKFNVLTALNIESSDTDEEEKLPIQAPAAPKSEVSRTVSTVTHTTTTTSRARSQARVKHTSVASASNTLKRLTVMPRKTVNIDWTQQQRTPETQLVVSTDVQDPLPFISSFQDDDDIDTDRSVTFSRSTSESSSILTMSSQDSNAPDIPVTDEQKKTLKLFGTKCRNEMTNLHQRMAAYHKRLQVYSKQCEKLMVLEKTANDFSYPTSRSMENKLSSLKKRTDGLPQVRGEENCAAKRIQDALLEVTGFLAED